MIQSCEVLPLASERTWSCDVKHSNRFSFIAVKVLLVTYIGIVTTWISSLVFGSDDDVSAATAVIDGNSPMQAAWNGAITQGRIPSFLVRFLWIVPYKYLVNPDQIVVFRFVYFGISFIVLAYISWKLLGSRPFLIFVLLFTGVMNYTGWYNPLTAFMFWFFSSLILYLAAGIFLVKYLHTKRFIFLLLHTFSFSYALFSYEIYFLGIVFYMALMISQTNEHKITSYLSRNVFLVWIFVYSTYIALYLFFSLRHPSQYTGTQLSNEFDFQDFINYLKYTFGHTNFSVIHRLRDIVAFASSLDLNLIYLPVYFILTLFLAIFIGNIVAINLLNNSQNQKSKAYISIDSKSNLTIFGLHFSKTITFYSLMVIQIFLFNIPLFLTKKYQNLDYVEPYGSSLPSTVIFLITLSLFLNSFFDKTGIHRSPSVFSKVKLISILLSFLFIVSNMGNVYFLNFWKTNSSVWHLMYDGVENQKLEFGTNKLSTVNLFWISRTTVYPYWQKYFERNSLENDIEIKVFRNFKDALAEENRDFIDAFKVDCGVVLILINRKYEGNSVTSTTSCEKYSLNISLSNNDSIDANIYRDKWKVFNFGEKIIDLK